MSEKRLVGLRYELDDSAPRVMLKAAGEPADELLRLANRRDDMPIVRDAELLSQLYRVPMDQPIAAELFPVIAVLLAHVLRLDQSSKEVGS